MSRGTWRGGFTFFIFWQGCVWGLGSGGRVVGWNFRRRRFLSRRRIACLCDFNIKAVK